MVVKCGWGVLKSEWHDQILYVVQKAVFIPFLTFCSLPLLLNVVIILRFMQISESSRLQTRATSGRGLTSCKAVMSW